MPKISSTALRQHGCLPKQIDPKTVMKTSSSTRTNSTPSAAALNNLYLQSPQPYDAPLRLRGPAESSPVDIVESYPICPLDANLPSKGPLTQIVPTVEITIGPDPQVLIQRAINKVGHPALRTFLRTVMAERDVNRVLTLLLDDGRKAQRLPIDRLRCAAETARNRSMLSAPAREILYAAVLISGIESLLGETVRPPYTSGDVIRSVVRDALRQLEQQDEERACELRNFLGWGNDDESGACVQEVQRTVCHAVKHLRAHRSQVRQSQYA